MSPLLEMPHTHADTPLKLTKDLHNVPSPRTPAISPLSCTHTRLWKTYSVPGTVLGAGGTEMSKTGFLPLRSSQATEGDRHRNNHRTTWHVYRSLHKVPQGNRGGNKFCPGRAGDLRAHRHSIPGLSVIT